MVSVMRTSVPVATDNFGGADQRNNHGGADQRNNHGEANQRNPLV
jgi:hypothetical protein